MVPGKMEISFMVFHTAKIGSVNLGFRKICRERTSNIAVIQSQQKISLRLIETLKVGPLVNSFQQIGKQKQYMKFSALKIHSSLLYVF